MTGQLGILSVGAGDIKLSFDPKNPAERIRAARVVTGMLRSGYALLIAVPDPGGGEPTYQRATAFDEATCEYIIADFDPTAAHQPRGASEPRRRRSDEEAASPELRSGSPREDGGEGDPSEEPPGTNPDVVTFKRPRGRSATRRVDAATTDALAVGRSAGG